ncbi:hypothetical protein D9M68_797970 [compost metagenome]
MHTGQAVEGLPQGRLTAQYQFIALQHLGRADHLAERAAEHAGVDHGGAQLQRYCGVSGQGGCIGSQGERHGPGKWMAAFHVNLEIIGGTFRRTRALLAEGEQLSRQARRASNIYCYNITIKN